jgi:predicted permease
VTRRFRAFAVRAAASLWRSRADQDMNAELESHLQLHIDDQIRAGVPPDEARRRAVLALGGLEPAKERYRDRRGLPLVDGLRQDIVYGVRALRKNPSFTATAVLTLALGVGATSAIFSVINAVLLQPLPFPEPGRLVMVYGNRENGDTHDVLSYPTFVDWRNQSRSFTAAAFVNRRVTLNAEGQNELVPVKLVSSAFLRVLSVQPALGRGFQPQDDADPPAPVAILSDGFWRRRFGAAGDVLGKTIRLSDTTYTVVGVMPTGFHFDEPEREHIYLPLPIDVNRKHGFLRIVARLQPWASIDQARLDLDGIAARLTRIYPRNEARSSTVEPLVVSLAGPSRLALLILFGIVTLLLLIASANVAGLLLARGISRQRELALRAALGASRGRIARQLLTESLLLALAGGAAGLLLASWLARLLVVIVSTTFAVPRLDATHTDGAVVLFALAVSIATGIIFGVVPAWGGAAPDLNRSLRDATQQTSGLRMPRLGRLLVVVQTALALVLLAGAGTLTRTLLTMRATHPGFDTRRLIAFELWLPASRLPHSEDSARFFSAALTRTHRLPGVESAAIVADLPLGGATDSQSFHIVGRPDPAPEPAFKSGFNVASAGYFHMMGIPIREGRDFEDRDGHDAPAVAIVNESAIRRFWPDRSPVGSQISLPLTRTRSMLLTIVGVAGDVRHLGLAEPPRPEIFINSLQSELAWSEAVLTVRSAVADPTRLAASIKAALHEVDPNVPVARVRTMEEIVEGTLAEPRLFAWLVGGFAFAAVTLAAIGLYGLISYTVTQRAREMGIRLALGASSAGVMRLVLGQGVRLASLGTVLGVAGGLAATRVLVGLVKGVEPNDPATFAAVVAVLFATALIAAWLPARRAARVDPIRALRIE